MASYDYANNYGAGWGGGYPGTGPGYPGYQQLLQQVLGQIQNEGSAMTTQINKTYAHDLGEQQVGEMGSGLWNSSMRFSDNNQLKSDRKLALDSLATQLAALSAGHTASIGSMGLQAQGGYQQMQNQFSQQMQMLQAQYAQPQANLQQNLQAAAWKPSGMGSIWQNLYG